MTAFLTYQAKAAVALALFYMFYRLLLSRETLHRLNRIVLLGTAALSFVLPFCIITVTKTVTVPAMPAAAVTSEGTAAADAGAGEWWQTALVVIFAAGALAVIASVAVSLVRIRRIISSGEHHRLDSGEILVTAGPDTQPFSWMKYIVLSREDSDNEEIITHERAHIAMRHSADLLFADIMTAMQWFNPAIWMLRTDLRALHEYEADEAVLRSGADIRKYQYLLIRKAVGKSGYSVANSFNHSTLKQRITMMLNKKSTRSSALKALYVLPLVCVSLAAGARTSVEYVCDSPSGAASADSLRKVTQISVKKGDDGSYSAKNVRVQVRKAVDAASDDIPSYYGSATPALLEYLGSATPAPLESSEAAPVKVSVVRIETEDTGTDSKITFDGRRNMNNVQYVVNGKKTDDIASVSTDDIVSIEILKDAESLKAYGAEDKKAVIVITTRK